MNQDRILKLKSEIQNLHRSVSTLKELFPSKEDGFTLDGRLVGDIGEVIAEELFQITLYKGVQNYYDAYTTYKPNLKVQIKATFKDSLTFNHNPEYFIGIKLDADGEFEVVYNGPGRFIFEEYKHRKGIGTQLLSFPIKKLKEISKKIDESERILLK